MEHQSTQQQSSEKDLKLPQTDHPQLLSSNGLVAMLKRHPWLLWSGIWVLLLSAAAFISSIAIFSLTHTGRISHQEPQQRTVAAEKPEASQTPGVMSLWVLGAVALTCTAAGYLVISKQSAKLDKSVKHSAARVPTRRQRRQRLLHEQPPSFPSKLTPITPPVPAEIETVVTVLPPEQSHPLDAGEESLAEMMDIRKDRPLSSILGETFIEDSE